MKLGTIKRYLEHYPASFLLRRAIVKSAAKLGKMRFKKNHRYSSLARDISTQSLKPFSLPHLSRNQKALVLKKADAVVNGFIPVFSEIYPGKINWQRDYVNARNIGEQGCDVRIVWELNRLHLLVWLAQAYSFAKRKKYLNKFKEICLDWMEKNPEDSLTWHPMECAIRAVNLCFAFPVFYRYIEDEDFWNKFFSMLFTHGVYIRNNLEWTPKIRNNHYLCNLIGLLCLGALFEKTENGKEWLSFSYSELQRELNYQVLSDGVDFEKSTWYHGFATEIFLTAYQIFKAKKLGVSKSFQHGLKKMLEFLHLVKRSDDSLVLIGDGDSGRLLRFYPCASFEDVLQRARGLYTPLANGLHLFDKSGFAVYRGENVLLTFFAGSTGTLGTGGHTHNSALSFTLDVGNKPVFIDPGTYIYTGNPEMRNLFRSTAYHNTVGIDNSEQNYFDEKHLFKLFDKTKAEITFAGKVRGAFTIAGRHHGYEDKGVIHERLVSINPKKRLISIIDNFEGRGIHNLEWNFHTSREVKRTAGGFLSGKAKLRSLLPGTINASWYSTRFSEKLNGSRITFSQRVLMPKLFKFLIEY